MEEEHKFPKAIVQSIYEFAKADVLVEIAQGVNFLAGVRRSFFTRSAHMSNRKGVTIDFITQAHHDFGTRCNGRFIVSLGFDQNYLKSDVQGDYRQPTLMEIRVDNKYTRVFNYYELRSMCAPWNGCTRKQIMFQVAKDILDYWAYCKSVPLLIHESMPLHIVDLKAYLSMCCAEKPFGIASGKEVVGCLMDLRF